MSLILNKARDPQEKVSRQPLPRAATHSLQAIISEENVACIRGIAMIIIIRIYNYLWRRYFGSYNIS